MRPSPTIALGLGVVVLLLAEDRGVTAQRSPAWHLRKISTSSVCLVQVSTAAPLGEFVSEHPSRKAACEAGKALYDGSMTDQRKCFAFGPATKTGCRAEGTDLP